MASDRSMCPDSASKGEYQDIPGGKGSQCVRLTTYHLHVSIVKKSGGLYLLEPCGPVQACNGTAFTHIDINFVDHKVLVMSTSHDSPCMLCAKLLGVKYSKLCGRKFIKDNIF